MPYGSISELPSQFSDSPDKAKRIAMHVVNSSLDRGLSEERAFKSAWGAIMQVYKKEGDSWVEKKSIDDKFEVWTDEFKSIIVGNEFFVEGVLYLAGKPDEARNKFGSFDMATEGCIEDMLNQIKGKEVKAVFKLGLDHDNFLSETPQLVPRAKIVDAWIDSNFMALDGKTYKALIAKTHVNRAHPDFEFIKGSIEGGFLDSYSMEFAPLKTRDIEIGGNPLRILDRVKLGGATFTGRPISEACKLTDFYCKSLAIDEINSELKEVIQMETKIETKVEEIKAVVPEVKTEVKSDNSEFLKQIEVKDMEILELKSKVDEMTKLVEIKAKELEMKNKELEIKATVEKVEVKPENKSLVEPNQIKTNKNELKSLAWEDFMAARLGGN